MKKRIFFLMFVKKMLPSFKNLRMTLTLKFDTNIARKWLGYKYLLLSTFGNKTFRVALKDSKRFGGVIFFMK